MDYRTLMRQAAAAGGAPGAHGCADGSDGTCAGELGDAAADAGADALETGFLGAEQEDSLGCTTRAPPPKRGRYVTAGPAEPGSPSLQYCTALHLAALRGQVESVQALLATGQVRGRASLVCCLASAAASCIRC